jgi:hypothetical protein
MSMMVGTVDAVVVVWLRVSYSGMVRPSWVAAPKVSGVSSD